MKDANLGERGAEPFLIPFDSQIVLYPPPRLVLVFAFISKHCDVHQLPVVIPSYLITMQFVLTSLNVALDACIFGHTERKPRI